MSRPTGVRSTTPPRRTSSSAGGRSRPIAKVLPALRASLTAVAEDAEHIMVVTAADGLVLWREGSARVGRLADSLGFLPGADWTEASVGTNAIGTALAEHASVQLFSAEHFVRAQHPWTCTASPIHDPRTGEMLGVVDLSGPAPTVHPTTVALVHTAVRLAESGLWTQHEARLDGLRAVAAPLLAREHGPALVVDDHGWVAATTGLAPRDRVAVPGSGEALLVHGLGACLPERVPGGWMLRPSEHGGGGRDPAAARPARRPARGRRRGTGAVATRPLAAPPADPRPAHVRRAPRASTPPRSAGRSTTTPTTSSRSARSCRGCGGCSAG